MRLNYLQGRLYQTISKGILPNLAIGLGIQFDRYYKLRIDETYSQNLSGYEKYGDITLEAYSFDGLTIDLVFDNRRNTIDPDKGAYFIASFRQNAKFIGSLKIWNSINIEARKYFPVSKKRDQILALRALYLSILSGEPNYLDLPSNGWDNNGKTTRGIYRNRYRSSGLLYFEAEYRTAITKNGLWGMATFCNLTSSALLFTQQYQRPYFAGGAGLRLKLDKRTGSKLSFDIGVSKE